ncbi:pyridoxamine 5'-phosphate oxidase [Streptomyces sp. NRRL F-5755]|uniref:pyridoxamine 5'-phosphate oxidase family protein n=1 Tax=Streptomyces sp. NRRL F-5755 TaxID=1519475 RepID=UPI0006AE763C|nr:pyridoxamine 5'-phosphate oxidase family protein [Streptomyces sp. NRRL F-5755]KOT90247.1 pyridoxamine 5'-phosphate oxidase [Streptomyces sp. NRRL F-5755]
MNDEDAQQVEELREPVAPRGMQQLPRGESLRLLGSVPLGRLVFTQNALPAIRPVNHLMDGEDIIVRLNDGATLTSIAPPAGEAGLVVAYEADTIDPRTHLGWSVIVTGYARLVADPAQVARYESLLRPWVQQTMNGVLRIQPDLVTGFRLVAQPAVAACAAGGERR